MSSNPLFDRWYAAKHVKILLSPEHRLETFGNTLVNYTLVSELDDFPGKVRVREGRLEAHKPLVITPNMDIMTEGFGEEAKEYLEFLRDHADDVRIAIVLAYPNTPCSTLAPSIVFTSSYPFTPNI